ncbi:MAG TPA: DUF1801 domain-containing protein [Methanobacteriaceae archaeon]|nr:DUF1801 domain-containing protein [Methanobacteriaceae archaeon]
MAARVNVEEYLKQYPDKMAGLALKTRELILKTEPGLDEKIRWKNLTYGDKKMIMALVIHQKHLNLEFANGRELSEMGYLLEGTGKNIRHLKIRTKEDLESAVIPEVIKKSLESEINGILKK